MQFKLDMNAQQLQDALKESAAQLPYAMMVAVNKTADSPTPVYFGFRWY